MLEKFPYVFLLKFLLMTASEPWYCPGVDGLVIHVDVSLNILIINPPFVLCHQPAVSVPLLIPRLLNLTVQLFFILLHSQSLSLALRILFLLLAHDLLAHFVCIATFLQVPQKLGLLALVDLEVETLAVGRLGAEGRTLLRLLLHEGLGFLVRHCLQVLLLITLRELPNIIAHVVSKLPHLLLIPVLIFAEHIEISLSPFLSCLSMLLLYARVLHLLLSQPVLHVFLNRLLLRELVLVLVLVLLADVLLR